ncbi:hypothetical protein [Metabacillus litoralis]|uniref:hypothetical protein n=1 Tax=Metabacillus litoralis TaxID=152268 RepID=UPI00203C8E07|nr:hypothetical protein [Metabacillus litoralis]MCM3411232.1 hypothetical protein [Metabacillus litoralis]
MKHIVIRKFRDIHTNDLFDVGEPYETEDKERSIDLQKKGFIGSMLIEESLLSGNVNEVVEVINGEMSKERLEQLLQDEAEGKNRKTVIEHIESLLKGDEDESSKA